MFKNVLRSPIRSPIRSVVPMYGDIWTPAQLFSSGEQGVWYEPKPEYLYQDAAGTTPVTADGDPVGLMLDLSKGLGSEDLAESLDFSTWGENGLIVGGASPEFTLSVPADTSAAFIEKSMTTGFYGLYTYSVMIKKGAKNWVCLSPRISGLSSSARTWFNLDAGTVGAKGPRVSSATITPDPGGYYKCSVSVFVDASETTTGTFRIFAADADNSLSVTGSGLDDLFVKSATVAVDKKGNHATQSTSAARPIYRTDGTLHWLEFDGVDDVIGSSFAMPIPYIRVSGIGIITPIAETKYIFTGNTTKSTLYRRSSSAADEVTMFNGANGPVATLPSNVVVSEEYNAGTDRLFFDGELVSSVEAGDSDGTGLYIGGTPTGTNTSNIRFFGVAMAQGNDGSQRSQTESYFSKVTL